MKVIVFGATGSVGHLTVERLLNEGHEVTAFARSIEKLKIDQVTLNKVSGDALNPSEVEQAIKGHEAVIVVMGGGSSITSKVRSEGTRNVIKGMKSAGVSRLICQTTLGAGQSWNNLNFFWKRIMFGFLLRPVFKDHEIQEQLVRDSGLDWTIVRPSALTDDPVSRDFKINFPSSERRLTLKISRAEVAEFLTRCLREASFQKVAVGISH